MIYPSFFSLVSASFIKRASIACLSLLMINMTQIRMVQANEYASHPLFEAFSETMIKDHGFEKADLDTTFVGAKRLDKVIELMTRPAEKRLEWHEYRDLFLIPKTIRNGQAFLNEHQETFQAAMTEYQVPEQIIAAIMGVETRYGRIKGSHRAIDALATLSFDYPPRGKFFTKQLVALLQLEKNAGLEIKDLKGSYAGALGYPQFIPTSYQAYAVDFDKDGTTDLINNPVDAIGSVANYFIENGWKPGQPVVERIDVAPGDMAKLDKVANKSLKPYLSLSELKGLGIKPLQVVKDTDQFTLMKMEEKRGTSYWLGYHNFYAITRYNHSRLYALAVYELSRALKSE